MSDIQFLTLKIDGYLNWKAKFGCYLIKLGTRILEKQYMVSRIKDDDLAVKLTPKHD